MGADVGQCLTDLRSVGGLLTEHSFLFNPLDWRYLGFDYCLLCLLIFL